MYATLVILLIAISQDASAEFFACPTIDGDTYTESPSRSDCRVLEIQPPALVYQPARYGTGVMAVPAGPWPSGPAEAQEEICKIYQEWAGLAMKRYEGLVIYPPHGLTPIELNRLNNLDLLFSHRGKPNCGTTRREDWDCHLPGCQVEGLK